MSAILCKKCLDRICRVKPKSDKGKRYMFSSKKFSSRTEKNTFIIGLGSRREGPWGHLLSEQGRDTDLSGSIPMHAVLEDCIRLQERGYSSDEPLPLCIWCFWVWSPSMSTGRQHKYAYSSVLASLRMHRAWSIEPSLLTCAGIRDHLWRSVKVREPNTRLCRNWIVGQTVVHVVQCSFKITRT